MTETTPSPLGNVITIDDERIKSHLDRVVRGSVEETLNALLDAEADRLCNAQRYERSEARRDTRAGHYERKLQTKAGEVRLKVPKLRQQTFETAIIERYRRRESSVEEALIEMYLAGVSVRRVEDITEALWGTRVSRARSDCSSNRLATTNYFGQFDCNVCIALLMCSSGITPRRARLLSLMDTSSSGTACQVFATRADAFSGSSTKVPGGTTLAMRAAG